MIDIGIILSGVGLAKSIAELTGLMESMDAKIDKLSQSELAAALRNLDQACSSKVEELSLLRESRSCFNKAIGLESGYRRGVSYFGLALCHSYLEDRENCSKALKELLEIMPSPSIWTELNAKEVADSQNKNWLEKVLFQSSALNNLLVITTRRAKFIPENFRRFSQPSKRELILGITMDADAKSLAKLQNLVADHLGLTPEWMIKNEITPKDLGF